MAFAENVFDRAVISALQARVGKRLNIAQLRVDAQIRRGIFEHLRDMRQRGIVTYDYPEGGSATPETVVWLSPEYMDS